MADNTQTSDLVIRARDLSSQPIKDVIEAVGKLSAALEVQSRVAERGSGSIKDLNVAVTAQDNALKALISQQGKLDQFLVTLARFGTATEGQAQAKQAIEDFTAAAEAAGVKVKKSDPEFKALTDTFRKLSAEAKSAEKSLYTQGVVLEKLGVDSTKVVQAQGQVAEAIARTTAALRVGEVAQANFSIDMNRANTLKAENNRLAEEELKLANLRRIAQEAVAKAPATAPLGQAVLPDPGFSSASQALTNILAPAAAARASIAGVQKEIANLTAGFEAGTKTSKEYAADLHVLAVATTELGRQASLIDAYRRQEEATRRAQVAMLAERDTLTQLNTQVKAATEVDSELEKRVLAVGKAYEKATSDFNAQNEALSRGRAAIAAIGVDYQNIERSIVKLEDSARQASSVFVQLSSAVKGGGPGGTGAVFLGLRPYELQNLSYQVNDVITQISSGTSVTQTFAQQGGQIFQLFQKQLLGTILSFRTFVNGIVGPGGFALSLGVLGLSIAAVTLTIAALVHAMSERSVVRDFNARLLATADATETTGKALTEAAKTIRGFGASLDDAQKAIHIFTTEGVNPARLVEFGKAAQNTVDVFGGTLPEAATKVAQAFTKGYDAIYAYDKALNFLTASELAHIRDLFDQGKAEEGRAAALDIYTAKMQKAADEARGPWTLAFRGLKNAWNELMDSFAHSSAISLATSLMTGLVNVLALAASGADRLSRTQIGFGGSTGIGLTVTGPTDTAAESAIRLRQTDEKLAAAKTAAADAARAAALTGDNALTRGMIARADAMVTRLQAQSDALHKIVALQTQVTTGADGEATARERIAGTQAAVRAAGEEQKKRNDEERDRLQNETNLERNRSARGELAQELQAARLNELVKAKKNAIASKGADPEAPEIVAELDRFRETERLKDQMRLDSAETAAKITAKSEERQAEDHRKGLKGRQRENADNEVVDRKMIDLANQYAKAEGITLGAAQIKYAKEIGKERTALAEGFARERANADKAGAGKAINAEEGLMAALLAIKAKVDAADKTNLQARLRAIDEEYGKMEFTIAKAKRAGVTSVGGQSFAEFTAAIEAQKEILKNNTTVTFYEENLNKKLAERKTEYTAINEALAEGTISVETAFKRTTEVTSRLGQEIRKAAADAVALAKTLPQTSKTQAFIAVQQAKVNQSPEAENRIGAEGAFAAAMKPVNELIKDRTELESAQRTLMKDGVITSTQGEASIRAAYEATTDKINAATDAIAVQLAEQLKLGKINQTVYDAWIAHLTNVRAKAVYVSDEMKALYKVIEDSFANRAGAALESVAQKLGQFAAGTAKMKDVVASVGQAFSAFTAGVLLDISKMILKTAILKAVQAGLSAAGFPEASAALGAVAPVASKHSGGVIGANDNTTRMVDPAWFRNAPRFHSGSIVGLRSDEQAAILQKGEEVLSKTSPRNVMNANRGGTTEVASRPIRQVLVFDPKDLSQAMAGSHGESVTLTHIRANTGAIRQMLK